MDEQAARSLIAAFDAMQEGFGVFDADLNLIVCNERYIAIREYPRALCQPGVPLAALLRFNAVRGDYGDVDVDKLVRDRITRVLEFTAHEVERGLPNGRRIIVRYTPVDGVGILSTFVDVTDLRTAEDKVAEMARLPDRNPEPVLRFKGDGTLVYFNPAAIRLVTDLDLAIDAPAPADWIEQFALARRREDAISMDVEAGERTYVLTVAPVAGANKFNLYGRDVTELKEAEQVVAALAKLPEQNPGPVLRFGSGFDFQYANPAAQKLVDRLQLSPEKAPPDVWVEAMARCMDSALPTEFEYRFDEQDYALLAVPVAGTELINIYGRDITQRKAAEDALRDAKEAAEDALAKLQIAQKTLVHTEKMASLGQLTAGIAHEIKNPLNFVNNFARLAGDLLVEYHDITRPLLEKVSAEDRDDAEDLIDTIGENLRKIGEHGRRADDIVKGMLAHARQGPASSSHVDVNAMLEESINLAYHGMRAKYSDFNATLERNLAPSLPQIECFPQEISRVFLNLASNGLYALRQRSRAETGSEYRACLKVTSRLEKAQVVIVLRDNGTGMPAEVVERIFQPFFTTKPTGEGTGLGLSLSFDIIVQQHRGSMTVESVVGNFTEFTMCLPFSLPAGTPTNGDRAS
jgi:signal transduction histidine kinase